MRMKKSLLVVLTLGLLSTGAFAAPYGASGCGLGSMLFKNKSSLVHQVLASTTNGSSGNQTFGMTTGTSNCRLGSGGKRAQALFIQNNKVALANDIARGNGETLASLTRLYGCSAENQGVGSILQKNYQRIFPSQDVAPAKIDMAISHIIEENSACI